MCRFSVAFQESATELVADLKKEIQDHQGSFTGDTSSGSFDLPIAFGHVSGTYTIKENSLDVTITHRPPLVSCAEIEDMVRHHLNTQHRF
jgi:hypothetical protein